MLHVCEMTCGRLRNTLLIFLFCFLVSYTCCEKMNCVILVDFYLGMNLLLNEFVDQY